jgi:hypothetical protein
MSRTDWITIAVTLICILFSDEIGGHKAALVCGAVGLIILIILRLRETKTPKQFSTEQEAQDVQLEHLLAISDGKTKIQAETYIRPWIGKRIRLSARLYDVSPLSGDEFMVSLTTPSGFNSCYFYAPKTQLNDFAHLQQGNTITVEGIIDSIDPHVHLSKVRLIAVEGRTVATI